MKSHESGMRQECDQPLIKIGPGDGYYKTDHRPEVPAWAAILGLVGYFIVLAYVVMDLCK